jgi:predicted transcriptional regulator
MKVKDAMHKGAFWVGPDTSITDIANLMRKNDIGAVPIGENDILIGMVTDRDIVCKGLAKDSFDVRRATARDVMTSGIHCCGEEDDRLFCPLRRSRPCHRDSAGCRRVR